MRWCSGAAPPDSKRSSRTPWTYSSGSCRSSTARAFSARCPVAGARVPIYGTTAENRNRSEEHTSELQSRSDLVCRLLLEKKKKKKTNKYIRRTPRRTKVLQKRKSRLYRTRNE